jgi:hypothetical protein
LWKFSAIMLLTKMSVPLVCISSPSSIPMICKFGLLMVSQRSCIFHSYFLSNFSCSLSNNLIPLLYHPYLILYFLPAPLY